SPPGKCKLVSFAAALSRSNRAPGRPSLARPLLWPVRQRLSEAISGVTSFERGGTMLADENVSVRVARVLVEALNVDEDEIRPAATLQGDLGAESIDFLDVVFRLEREFGIKIPRGELFPEAIFEGDPDFVQDGRVTDKGLAELGRACPSPTSAAS